jgi:hypothetical protein
MREIAAQEGRPGWGAWDAVWDTFDFAGHVGTTTNIDSQVSIDLLSSTKANCGNTDITLA